MTVHKEEKAILPMAKPCKVNICLTGDHEALEAVRSVLLHLNIEGIHVTIDIPRSARKTDDFAMLTRGTITLAGEREIGAQHNAE
jgi:hypothetical protein